MGHALLIDKERTPRTALRELIEGSDARVAYAAADELYERCHDLGISVVTALDAEYPPRLLQIPDWPVVLFIRGNVTALKANLVAVVGTRKASQTGISYATRMARELVNMGVGVVSGLARGVDAAAHRGALKGRGLTIAVMAHGLDSVSPRSHQALASEIIEAGGTLVSEHGPGVPARPPEFVRRNRLQSGIAFASLIVESGAVGGAIHQARFTRDQGRKLYVFLPPAGAPGSESFERSGAYRLMNELNAAPVSTMEDLRAVVALRP